MDAFKFLVIESLLSFFVYEHGKDVNMICKGIIFAL